MTKFKKNRIIKIAKQSDCDLDGDVVIYNGEIYCVYILRNQVGLVQKNVLNEPWLKRRKIRGRFPDHIKYRKSLFEKFSSFLIERTKGG